MLALGAGCKDSHGGKGPTGDGSISEDDDGGSGTRSDGGDAGGSGLDGGGTADAGADGSSTGGDGGNNGDGGEGTGDGDGGTDAAADDDGGGTGGDAGDAGSVAMTIADKTSVDFGLADCAGMAPPSQTFTLTNTGTVGVAYTVTLSNTKAFSIAGSDGGLSGTVAPGADVTVTLNAAAVPDTASAGVAIGGTATITTSLPAPNNSFVIPLSVTPRGVHLTLEPAGGANWILVQTGEGPTYSALTLGNTGNAAADVTVTQPTNAAFGLYNGTSTTELSSALNIAAAGTGGLNASFDPQTNGAYTSKAMLTVAGAVCNGGASASITEIPFEGAASNSGLSVQRTAFPDRVNCGTATPPSSTVTVRNYTPNPMTVALSTLKQAADSPFTLSQSSLSLTPGGTSSFDIMLKASEVPQTATPGTILDDSIVIDPSDPTLSQRIFKLTTTIQGAHLVYADQPDMMGNPTGVFAVGAFDGANAVATVAKTIGIRNTGNYPAAPTFSITPADGIFAQTGALTPAAIPGGSPGTGSIAVTFTPVANDQAMKSATLQIAAGAGDVICGALPTAKTLSGTPTMPGFQLLTASPVEFGDQGAVDCPTPSALNAFGPFGTEMKTVQFANNGQADLEWTASVSNPAAFSLSSTSGTILGSINAMGMTPAPATITVTAPDLPFPPSLDETVYSGDLIITTNIPGDAAKVIPLKRYARGAVIKAEVVNDTFGEVNVNFVSEALTLYTLSNTGNTSADLQVVGSVSTTAANGPEYTFNNVAVRKGADGTLNAVLVPGTPLEVSGDFDPAFMAYDPAQDQVMSTFSMVINTTSAVCDAIVPPSVSVTGTGTDLVGFNVPANLAFAASGSEHVCGASRPEAPKTFIISNYSLDSALTIQSIALSSETWFTAYIGSQGTTQNVVVQPATMGTDGTFSPGTAVAVVVPKTVPASGMNVPSTLTAQLTVTASLANTQSTTKTVNITEYIDCTFP